MRTALWILAGVGALVGAGLLAANAFIASPSGAPDASVLSFRSGQQFTYRFSGLTEGSLSVSVLAPRLTAAPDLAQEPSLPLVIAVRTAASEAVSAEALSLASGGVLLLGDACLFDRAIACDSVFVSWQDCPLVGFLGTASMVRLSDLDGPRWTVPDPVGGNTWTYAVEKTRGGRATLTLDAAAPQLRTCFVPKAMEFDTRDRTLASITVRDGTRMVLDFVTQGSGAALSFGTADPREHRFVSPERPRQAPYPPGAGSLGPPDWTLQKAWGHAVQNAPELARFLAAHPDAFLYSAADGSTTADVAGGLTTRTSEWAFQVLSPSRSMLDITARRTTTAGVPQEESKARSASPPADVPHGFLPARDRMADLQDFVQAARARGLEPIAREPMGSFDVTLVANEPAEFVYAITLGEGEVAGQGFGGAVSTSWLTLSASTGRLSSTILPVQQARSLLTSDGLG